MKKLIAILLLISCINFAQAQEVPIVKFDAIQKLIESKEPEILIINFWATWCAPCVSELPIFDKYYSEKPTNTAMYLINLDFVDKIGRVKSFIKRKNLKPPVLLLDETDYNTWIDRVDNSWGGAIPATLVINTKTGKRKFVGKEVTESEFQQMISDIKN